MVSQEIKNHYHNVITILFYFRDPRLHVKSQNSNGSAYETLQCSRTFCTYVTNSQGLTLVLQMNNKKLGYVFLCFDS